MLAGLLLRPPDTRAGRVARRCKEEVPRAARVADALEVVCVGVSQQAPLGVKLCQRIPKTVVNLSGPLATDAKTPMNPLRRRRESNPRSGFCSARLAVSVSPDTFISGRFVWIRSDQCPRVRARCCQIVVKRVWAERDEGAWPCAVALTRRPCQHSMAFA